MVLQRTSTICPFVSIPYLYYKPPIEEIKHEFPYFNELNQIWQGIPGFDSNLILSDPTMDHSHDMLSLTQTKATSVSQLRRRTLTTEHSMILTMNMMILTDSESTRKEMVIMVLNMLICRLMMLAGK